MSYPLPAASIENNYTRIGVPTSPGPISPIAAPYRFSQSARTDHLAAFHYGALLEMRGAFSGKFWQFAALASWLSLTLSRPAPAEKRLPLVIGNSAYQNVTRLDN